MSNYIKKWLDRNVNSQSTHSVIASYLQTDTKLITLKEPPLVFNGQCVFDIEQISDEHALKIIEFVELGKPMF